MKACGASEADEGIPSGGSLEGRAAAPVSAAPEKPERAGDPEAESAQEIHLGVDRPEEGAAKGGHRDNRVAHEIVQAEHPRLAPFGSQLQNQRLARRLAELLQPAQNEGKGERPERSRE